MIRVKTECISNILGIVSLHHQLLPSEQSLMMGIATACDTEVHSILTWLTAQEVFIVEHSTRVSLSFRENVQQIRYQLWPQRQEECIRVLRARDARGREDRKQRIQEKQSQIIEEFAYLRRQFMEKAMKTGTMLGRLLLPYVKQKTVYGCFPRSLVCLSTRMLLTKVNCFFVVVCKQHRCTL